MTRSLNREPLPSEQLRSPIRRRERPRPIATPPSVQAPSLLEAAQPKGNNGLDARKLIVLAALALALLAMVGCSRIAKPEGGSGGTVVGDVLYIGTEDGMLVALDLTSDGRELSRFELAGEEDDRAFYGTPAVAGGTVYIGGYDSIFYALDERDLAEVKWQERLGGPIIGGAAVVDDLVLVGSSDGNMYAFDISEEDGSGTQVEEAWRFPTGDMVWSSPAVAAGVVYFGSIDHNLYAVSLEDGTKVWQFPTKGAITASPVVARGRVYVGSFDGVFYAVDAASGEEVWRFEGASNWYWGKAVVFEGAVYAPSLDGNLYALNIDTGRRDWTLETEGAIVGAPAVVRDMIAVPSSDGIRLARLRDGLELDACNIGEKVTTPLVEEAGSIYFGAADGSVRALRIKSNGNPDEEWVRFAKEDKPVAC